MLKIFKKAFSFLFSRELDILSLPRSKEWKKVREAHLKKQPLCAVCGNSKNVVPHHIVPFHVDPSKELDPSNLITLCEGDTFNCHLFFGHFRNWIKYNPKVAEDASEWSKKINSFAYPEEHSSSQL